MPSGASCLNMYTWQSSTAEDPADIVLDKHDTLYAGNEQRVQTGVLESMPERTIQ